MATKPATVPRWAHTGATEASNVVAPSSGEQNTGYVTDQVASSSKINWLFRWIYAWVDWLNAAEVDFGTATVRADRFQVDTEFTGALVATGDLKGTDLLHTTYHEHAVSYLSFMFDESGDPSVHNVLGYLTSPAGVTLARAPLDFLKVDDVITYAEVFYNPNGGGNMEPKLGRIALATGTVDYTPWDGATDSTGTAIESQNSGAITHTVAAGYSYFFESLFSGAANRLHGGIVRYTRPT